MLDWYFPILNILLTDSSFGYLGENLIFLDKNAKAFDKLTFTVKGDANIVAVDNGNISSDELHIGKTQLEKNNQRNLFQGSALVILRAGKQNGKVELLVSSDKMKARKLVLNTK